MSKLDVNRVFADAMYNATSSENHAQIVADVPWPVHEHFGHDHAKWTAKLAERALRAVFEQRSLGEPPPHAIDVITGAAMFHDLGRRLAPADSWRTQEPEHAKRSAEIAEQVMRTNESWRFKQGAHAEICALIARHKLPPLGRDDGRRPTDPFEIALWDAECFESSRFEPNTDAGLLITRERFNQTVSAWARLPEHRQRWRAERWRRAKG
jgi:hypothetical protein